MTENVDKKEIEDDELICPITFELFRDPVKAKDGHVYEREAITRWILQHGTSPLTRQPLQVNDLQPDHHLRNLAKQKRNSTVSYNTLNDTVTLPPLQHVLRNTRQITPEIDNQIRINIQRRDYSNKIVILIFFFSFIFPVSLIIGIVVGLKNSFSQDIDITSRYSDVLTRNDSYINRTTNSNSDYYYYKTIEIVISTDGFYGFEIKSESYVSIDGDLYFNSFNYTNLSYNLFTYTYKDKSYTRTYLGNWIQSEKYILMITTYFCCSEGPFQILVTGPANVDFH